MIKLRVQSRGLVRIDPQAALDKMGQAGCFDLCFLD